jgi:hypothetical protein
VTRMVYRRSDEAFGLQVEQMAQMLVQAGQRDPSLLSRSQVTSAGRHGEVASERHPLKSVEHHLAAAPADPYMEQLVAIALASAHRAEDASELASQTGRIAKRSATLFTVLGTICGLAGIAGIVDHRFNDRLTPGLAAIASDDQPQRPTSGLSSKMEDQALERAPIDPVGHQSRSAPMPHATVGGALAPDNFVIARSSAEQPDAGQGATTAPLANQVSPGVNAPTGGTVGQAYPTQPYGFNASTSVQSLPSRAYVPSSAQQWPARTYGAPLPRQYHYIPRRVATSYGSGPSGNPVRDFQRFVTALGQGVRSIFR